MAVDVKDGLAVSIKTKTIEEKLALLESLPAESWELIELVKEHGPWLLRLLKTLIERPGSGDPPLPPIGFGKEPPDGMPDGPQIYFERYDDGAPVLWFHTGVRCDEWQRASAVARLGK